MAGHYGAIQQTTRNLEVFSLDLTNNIMEIKGPLPGPKGGLLIIEKTGKAKAYVAPPPEKPKEDEPESAEETKEEPKETAKEPENASA